MTQRSTKGWWPGVASGVTRVGVVLGAAGCVTACSGLLDLDGYDYVASSGGAGGEASGGAGGGPGAAGPGGGGQGGAGGEGAAGGSGGAGGASWQDPSYGYRRELTIANPTSETQEDVPVLVALDDQRIDYAAMEAGGEDLRFFAYDGASLSYEIERWDASGSSFVWVKVPELAPPDTRIWMYYGSPGASDAQDPPDVWSNGFVAVWHLTPPYGDSTGGHDLTTQGGSDVAGLSGGARHLDGADDYLTVGSPSGIDGVFTGGGTVSAWVRPAGWGGNGYGRIIDKSTGGTANTGWAVYFTTGRGGLRREFTGATAGWLTPDQSVSLNAWVGYTVVYDDGLGGPTLYLDGTSQTVETFAAPSGTPVADTGVPARIGNVATAADRGFDGEIDEVRLASTVRSAAWIRIQNDSMRDQLLTYGAEEAYAP